MDLTIGSIERSHLEAVAVQIEELEVRTAQSFEWAILESCYRAFGLARRPAAKATGSVVFTGLTPAEVLISIPAGTRLLSSSGQSFVTTESAQLGQGLSTTAAVPIIAMESGAIGNAPANSITRMASMIAGLDFVTNAYPTTGGKAEESDDSRAARFSAYVQTLEKGTGDALEYAALTVPAISHARAVEPFLLDARPSSIPYSGLVWLFCDDSLGLTPSNKALVEKVIYGYVDGDGNVVKGWKAAGVRVSILPSQLVTVRVRGTAKLLPGGAARWDAIKTALTAATVAYFSYLRIGDSISYQTLSAILNTLDSDVSELDLLLWNSADAAPGYGAVPIAADLSPVNVSVAPYTLGARCVLDQTSVYPEWVIA